MPAEPDLLRPHRLRPALAGSTSYAPTSYATTERTFGLRTTVAAYPSGDGSASGSSAAPHRTAAVEDDSNQLAFYQRQRYGISGARWSDMNPQMSAVGDGAAFVRLLEKGDNHRQAERTRIDRMESERSQIAREREQWQLEARAVPGGVALALRFDGCWEALAADLDARVGGGGGCGGGVGGCGKDTWACSAESMPGEGAWRKWFGGRSRLVGNKGVVEWLPPPPG